jgi:cytochrome c biogenesis protein CcmG/thiol:disulfide interchange protein DsbE
MRTGFGVSVRRSRRPVKRLSCRQLTCVEVGVWQALCVRLGGLGTRSAALLIGMLALAGCGGGQAKSVAPSKTSIAAAFNGSPPALASLHSQANKLLVGGPSTFHARLGAMRGHPVVVNLWASWCGPCQFEFPAYQKVAVALGKKVAFIGIDEKDHDVAAASFLGRFPVTYPSYTDPSGAILSSLKTYTGTPQTFFFSPSGKQVYDKAGPYATSTALERDIKFYLHVKA